MTQNTGITDSLKAFARIRGGTAQTASRLTDVQANFSPDPNSWSVAQNLDHLLLAEALYRGQMLRLLNLAREGKRRNIDVTLQEVDLNLPFVPKAMMPLMAVPLTMFNIFVPSVAREAVLRFPVMKAKNPKVMEPSATKPNAILFEELRSSLAETATLFAGELPPNAGQVTISHPVFGRNTIANVLALMAAHEERHGKQMMGVLRHPRFPDHFAR